MTSYHIKVSFGHHEKRTTVSLDKYLSELVCLRLGVEPDAPTAYQTVKTWIESLLNGKEHAPDFNLSRWVRHQAFDLIIDAQLNSTYGEWLLKK